MACGIYRITDLFLENTHRGIGAEGIRGPQNQPTEPGRPEASRDPRHMSHVDRRSVTQAAACAADR